MNVTVTTVEISPQAHYEYVSGAFANERLIVEALRREREIITRKQRILDERIEEAERVARTHLQTLKKLESEYGIGSKHAPGIANDLCGYATGNGSAYHLGSTSTHDYFSKRFGYR